jgi:hypothetical protein
MNTEQFFYRNVIYSKAGNTVSIIDIHKPEKKREDLEPWFGIVFQLADGQHTIEELYNLLAQKYTAGAPDDLLRTVTSVIDRLSEMKLIMLSDVKTELPYYLSMPYEMMDVEKAKKLLAEDRADIN